VCKCVLQNTKVCYKNLPEDVFHLPKCHGLIFKFHVKIWSLCFRFGEIQVFPGEKSVLMKKGLHWEFRLKFHRKSAATISTFSTLSGAFAPFRPTPSPTAVNEAKKH